MTHDNDDGGVALRICCVCLCVFVCPQLQKQWGRVPRSPSVASMQATQPRTWCVTYAHTHTQTCTHTYIHTHMRPHMHEPPAHMWSHKSKVYVFVYVCVHVYVCVCVCTCVNHRVLMGVDDKHTRSYSRRGQFATPGHPVNIFLLNPPASAAPGAHAAAAGATLADASGGPGGAAGPDGVALEGPMSISTPSDRTTGADSRTAPGGAGSSDVNTGGDGSQGHEPPKSAVSDFLLK